MLTQSNQLESSLAHKGIEIVLPAMDLIFQEAIELADSSLIDYLLTRLIYMTRDAGKYEELSEYLSILAKMSVKEPREYFEFARSITLHLGYASLARVEKDWDKSEFHYREALRMSVSSSRKWIEISTLQSLAELAWIQSDGSKAMAFLDSAQVKAETLELHLLLSSIFSLKAQIAEEEGQYVKALAFTRKMSEYQQEWEKREGGFDIKNYYLQQEKEKLEAEKHNRELELQLKDSQLSYFLVIGALALLLVTGLLIGLYKQREGRRQLAEQHDLIVLQTEQLKNLDEAKSRFFANVSHELRTPLSLMLGPIKTLLKENQLSEEQYRLIHIAEHNGKQLNLLVNEILDLRKMEIGQLQLNTEKTSLASFFNSYLAQFKSLAEHKRIMYIYEVELDPVLTARLDAEKCRRILYNLLSNAFKYTSVGGIINARIYLQGEWLNIVVSDNGQGIHSDDLPYLFNRYFQTTRPEKPVDGGTGIGLALSNEYVKLFGGQIEVESQPSQGSRFTVKFPIEILQIVHPSDDEKLKPVPVSLKNQLSLINKTEKPVILVVEDHPDLQAYIKMILSSKYHVLTTDNGQSALEILAQIQDCHLILSDLMMPIMDGFQLLERLKSSDTTRHIPVVMLTARAEVQDKLKALRIGVDDFIIKPFDDEELMVRVENLLKNQKIRSAVSDDNKTTKNTKAFISDKDQTWLADFEAYVKQHLGNEHLSVPQLAENFAMSESRLLRLLKRVTGLTPIQYLQEARLNEGRKLLVSRAYQSVSEVSRVVGYRDVRAFSRGFRKRFGKLPSEV